MQTMVEDHNLVPRVSPITCSMVLQAMESWARA